MRHVYRIPFVYDSQDTEYVHSVGFFHFYSGEEMPIDRLTEIVNEVRNGLPDGLRLREFENHVYRVLEANGLEKVDAVAHYDAIEPIRYDIKKGLLVK